MGVERRIKVDAQDMRKGSSDAVPKRIGKTTGMEKAKPAVGPSTGSFWSSMRIVRDRNHWRVAGYARHPDARTRMRVSLARVFLNHHATFMEGGRR
jgi:hypothetical protein